MSEHSESVKDASRRARKTSEQCRQTDPSRSAEFAAVADRLDAAAEYIIYMTGLTTALPHDVGNIHDLPAELLKELSVVKTDELEDQIVTVLNAYGGEADIDRVLIGLFRKFQVVQKRRFMQNKLWRMKDNGILWTVPGKKGVYTTIEPPEVEEDIPPEEPRFGAPEGAEWPDDEDSEIPF